MNVFMKASLLATVAMCAILTSCKKEEDIEHSPVGHATAKPSQPPTSVLTEDRPKRAKGKLRNSLLEDIEGAEVIMGRSTDSSAVDTVFSDTYGAFETVTEVNPGSYYVRIIASGYKPKYVTFVMPVSGTPLFDLGIITLVGVDVIED